MASLVLLSLNTGSHRTRGHTEHVFNTCLCLQSSAQQAEARLQLALKAAGKGRVTAHASRVTSPEDHQGALFAMQSSSGDAAHDAYCV